MRRHCDSVLLIEQRVFGENAVGRVIARPFTGSEGAFSRTQGRRDYALRPPGRTYLQELSEAGVRVHAVGKIDDLFAGVGIDESHPGATNELALDSVEGLLGEIDSGLVFANLIETDQLYGHRKDARGFAGALERIDARVGEMLPRLREGDLLVLTADHGVDPAHPGTDHTREYAPLLAISGEMIARPARGGGRRVGGDGRAGGGDGRAAGLGGRRHDGPLADVGASVLSWLAGPAALERARAHGLRGSAFVS